MDKPLVLMVQFKSYTKEAVSIVSFLVCETSSISTIWVKSMVVEASDITLKEVTSLLDSSIDPPDNEVNVPLLDYLEEENLDPNEEDLDNTRKPCNSHVILVWQVPLVCFPWYEPCALVANVN